MAKADLQYRAVTLLLGAVTHAVDLKTLLESLANAGHHVGEQRPRQTMQRSVLAAVVGPRHGEHALVQRDAHVGMKRARKRAARPLYRYRITLLAHLHARGHGNGHASDSRHDRYLPLD